MTARKRKCSQIDEKRYHNERESIKQYKKQKCQKSRTPKVTCQKAKYQENPEVQMVYEKCKQHENPEKLYQKPRYLENSEN